MFEDFEKWLVFKDKNEVVRMIGMDSAPSNDELKSYIREVREDHGNVKFSIQLVDAKTARKLRHW